MSAKSTRASARTKMHSKITQEGSSAGMDTLAEFPFTDYGNAVRMAKVAAAKLFYVLPSSKFYYFGGTHWIPDEHGVMALHWATNTVHRMHSDAIALRDTDVALADRLQEWAYESEGSERLEAMVDLVRAIPGMLREEWDYPKNPLVFNTHIGTLNIGTLTMKRHCSGQYLTSVHKLEDLPGHITANWESLLAWAFPENPTTRKSILRILEHSLSGKPLSYPIHDWGIKWGEPEKWDREMPYDSVRSFLCECVIDDARSFTAASDLRKAYVRWCSSTNNTPHIVRAFEHFLRRYDVPMTRKDKRLGWALRLKPDWRS